MGKKTYQSGGKYAKQGTQPKKRRPRKPTTPMNASDVSPQAETTDDSPKPVAQPISHTARRAHTTAAASYSYVISDLKRTCIFAAAAFAILIILAIVLKDNHQELFISFTNIIDIVRR